MSASASPPPIGDLRAGLAGRYRIDRELGAGGMAVVYLARDLQRDRDVALKVLRRELGIVSGVERFDREIRLSARLVHPHILPLLDSGLTEGHLWYTMPFVEGESLRARLDREKQLPVDEAIRLTREIADALGRAHSMGILHRDIKPENIL
ncbi:MAG: serine/threonine-protein kinase, partial [Gemmatimonadaceae bacterium]